MTSARQAVMSAISARLAGRPGPPLPDAAVPEGHTVPGSDYRVDAFTAALESVGSRVHAVTDEQEGSRVFADLIDEYGARTVACSDAQLLLPWTPAVEARCLIDTCEDPIPRDELLACDMGLCTAQFGIAETGTLVLLGDAERHRLVSLVPPAHVAVLRVQDLVADIGAALKRVASNEGGPPHVTTFITGPSRTADIELTLSVGVHGPRTLDVILLRD